MTSIIEGQPPFPIIPDTNPEKREPVVNNDRLLICLTGQSEDKRTTMTSVRAVAQAHQQITERGVYSVLFQGGITEAINAAKAAGGGIVLVDKSVTFGNATNVTSLTVPDGVTLQGVIEPGGKRADHNYADLPCAIYLRPNATIKLDDGAALRDLIICAEWLKTSGNIGSPAAARTAQRTMGAGNTGTAITIGQTDDNLGTSSHDVEMDNLLILGFTTAIKSQSNQRFTLRNVRGDNQNGIDIYRCHDLTRMRNLAFTPMLAGAYAEPIALPAIGSISASANGRVQVNFTSAHGLVTNDEVCVISALGVPAATNGVWKCVVLDGHTIEHPTLAFSGSQIGVAEAYSYPARRETGVRISSTDWPILEGFLAVGYQTGIRLEGHAYDNNAFRGCNNAFMTGGTLRYPAVLRDPASVGLHFREAAERNKVHAASIEGFHTLLLNEMTPRTTGEPVAPATTPPAGTQITGDPKRSRNTFTGVRFVSGITDQPATARLVARAMPLPAGRYIGSGLGAESSVDAQGAVSLVGCDLIDAPTDAATAQALAAVGCFATRAGGGSVITTKGAGVLGNLAI